jgi:outer membrane protein
MKTQYTSATMAAIALAMAGCVSAPPPERMDREWKPVSDSGPADAVWQEIRSAQPDLSHPLTLVEMTDIALRNNPATRRAWNEAWAASSQVRQAEGYFMPEITAMADVSRSGVSADTPAVHSDYLRYGPGVQISYLIFNFGGGRKAAVEQAIQTVRAANFSFNRALQDAVLAVQLGYHGVLGAQAAADAARTGVNDARTILDAAKARLNAGLGVELDVLQAQAGLDQSLYTLADAEGSLASAKGALAQAMCLPADAAVQIAPPAGDLPGDLAEADLKQMIDDALAKRPDIAALRAAAGARQASVRVNASAGWPSLYFDGYLRHGTYDTIAGNEMDDSQWPGGATLSLQWTLFNGFRTTALRDQAMAQAAAARETLRQAELAASAEVWTRYQQYRTALDRNRFAAASLASADASHRTAVDSFKAGLVGILDVLNAETLLAQARSRLVGARQDIFLSLARLAHASGSLESGLGQQPANAQSLSTDKERKP